MRGSSVLDGAPNTGRPVAATMQSSEKAFFLSCDVDLPVRIKIENFQVCSAAAKLTLLPMCTTRPSALARRSGDCG